MSAIERPHTLSVGLRGAAAHERRDYIGRLLEEDRSVSVAELARRFQVTETSIRRDLRLFQEQGLLKRVYGGAIAFPKHAQFGTTRANQGEHRPEKRRIAAAAAALVAPGDIVMFDSGTTVAQTAARIAQLGHLAGGITVVTHSLPVLDEIATWPDSNVIGLGGLYLPPFQAFVGPQTVSSIRSLSADIAFLGCDGLSVERGITTPHILVAEVGEAMAGRARRVVALADSSKLSHSGFVAIVPLGSIDLLITDQGADPEKLARIREAGCEVRVV